MNEIKDTKFTKTKLAEMDMTTLIGWGASIYFYLDMILTHKLQGITNEEDFNFIEDKLQAACKNLKEIVDYERN